MKKLIYMLLLVSFMFAAKVNVNLNVEDKVYHIGDRIFLQYNISAGEKYLFMLPDVKEYFKDIEIISANENKKLKHGKQFVEINAEIVSFDTGFVHIPQMPIVSTDSTGLGNPDTIFTPEKYIYIYSILDSAATPIAFNAPLPLAILTWWQVLIALLLLSAAVLLLVFGLKYHQDKQKVDEVIWESPIDKADFLLEALESKQYPENGKWKEFYLELTYIARDYFENIYYIHLQELTTSDLLPTLSVYLKDDRLNKMKELFTFADLVKFAKGAASFEKCSQHLNIIKQIIAEDKKNAVESVD